MQRKEEHSEKPPLLVRKGVGANGGFKAFWLCKQSYSSRAQEFDRWYEALQMLLTCLQKVHELLLKRGVNFQVRYRQSFLL